jgi:PDZ domain
LKTVFSSLSNMTTHAAFLVLLVQLLCAHGFLAPAAVGGVHRAGRVVLHANLELSLVKPLGLALEELHVGKPGVRVAEVRDGGSAKESGAVAAGMQLLELNGESLTKHQSTLQSSSSSPRYECLHGAALIAARRCTHTCRPGLHRHGL